jgi:hypothetical protein
MIKVTVTALALAFASPAICFADDQGAITGAAGGAVAGAVIGGPVGAVVGGVAGATVGGAATGPNRTVVVEPPPGPAPCASRTTHVTNNMGDSKTTTVTNCP